MQPEKTVIKMRCAQCNGLHTATNCPYSVGPRAPDWTLGPRLQSDGLVVRHQALLRGKAHGTAVLFHGNSTQSAAFQRRSQRLLALDLPGIQRTDRVGDLRGGLPFRLDEKTEVPTLAWWLRRGALTRQDAYDIGARFGYLLVALQRLGLPHGNLKTTTVRLHQVEGTWVVQLSELGALPSSATVDAEHYGLLVLSLLLGEDLPRGTAGSALMNATLPTEVSAALKRIADPRAPRTVGEILALANVLARLRTAPEQESGLLARLRRSLAV